MDRKHQLKYCQKCNKRAFDKSKGIVCSLTGEHATFEKTCPDFEGDQKVLEKEKIQKKEQAIEDKKDSHLVSAFFLIMAFPIICFLLYLFGDFYEDAAEMFRDIFVGGLLCFIFASALFRLAFFRYRFKRAIRIFGEDNAQMFGIISFGVMIVLFIIMRFYGVGS